MSQTIKVTEKFISHEAYKRRQYRRSDERNEEMGLGQVCVLCRVGVPGGSQVASAHHEILSKAQLPGTNNLIVLFALKNIAPACQEHHQALGHLRLIWLKALLTLGLASAQDYQSAPFQVYWDDRDYPPTMQCLGKFGYGSQYFRIDPMPESLNRFYKLAEPGFDSRCFCDYCQVRVLCRTLASEIQKDSDTVVIAIAAE